MGDIILTTALLEPIKKHFPDAEIDYLAEEPYSQLLLHHPALTHVFSLPARTNKEHLPKRLGNELGLLRKLRNRCYDLTIDLLGIPRSALLNRLSGAPVRVGGRFRYRHHLYTHKFDPQQAWTTAIDFHSLSLGAIGVSEAPSAPSIRLLPEEVESARSYLRKCGVEFSLPIVGLHVGATWPAKRWPATSFSRLVHDLLDELSVQVVITYGPKDRAIIDEMRSRLPEQAIVLDVLPLRKLAAVLSLLSVYVSNDCGPMHMAPAVGTATIGLFGPSEPEIWFPYARDDGHRALIHRVACHPCHQDFCPLEHQCMRGLKVSTVFQAVKETLYARNSEISSAPY